MQVVKYIFVDKLTICANKLKTHSLNIIFYSNQIDAHSDFEYLFIFTGTCTITTCYLSSMMYDDKTINYCTISASFGTTHVVSFGDSIF